MAQGITNIMALSKSRYLKVFWWEKLDETSRSHIDYCGSSQIDQNYFYLTFPTKNELKNSLILMMHNDQNQVPKMVPGM